MLMHAAQERRVHQRLTHRQSRPGRCYRSNDVPEERDPRIFEHEWEQGSRVIMNLTHERDRVGLAQAISVSATGRRSIRRARSRWRSGRWYHTHSPPSHAIRFLRFYATRLSLRARFCGRLRPSHPHRVALLVLRWVDFLVLRLARGPFTQTRGPAAHRVARCPEARGARPLALGDLSLLRRRRAHGHVSRIGAYASCASEDNFGGGAG